MEKSSSEVVKKSVPIEEGLFTIPSYGGQEGQLIGSKCRLCGEVFFPKRPICSNCTEENMEEIFLSRRGKLYSYSVVHQRTPEYRGENLPYAVGLIDLPEQVRVMSLLTDCDFGALKIGMDMGLVIEKLYVNDESNEVLAFKFRPA